MGFILTRQGKDVALGKLRNRGDVQQLNELSAPTTAPFESKARNIKNQNIMWNHSNKRINRKIQQKLWFSHVSLRDLSWPRTRSSDSPHQWWQSLALGQYAGLGQAEHHGCERRTHRFFGPGNDCYDAYL